MSLKKQKNKTRTGETSLVASVIFFAEYQIFVLALVVGVSLYIFSTAIVFNLTPFSFNFSWRSLVTFSMEAPAP